MGSFGRSFKERAMHSWVKRLYAHMSYIHYFSEFHLLGKPDTPKFAFINDLDSSIWTFVAYS
jgi:hypothetical protein